MDLPRVLMSGFEPFGSFEFNPSWQALVRASQGGLLPPDARFGLVEVPVTFDRAFVVFKRALLGFCPDVALCFGVHGGISGRGAETIYIERLARNRDAASKADNQGQVRAQCAIHPNAPLEISTRFAVEPFVSTLASDGFEAEVSDDAGGYLCNHLYFRAAHAFGAEIPILFVHVPPVEGVGGTMTLNRLASAVSLLAGEAARVGATTAKGKA